MSTSETFRATELKTGHCGHCSQPNEAAAKYCGGCGQPLWESCHACDTTAPIGRRFCGGCGANLQEQTNKYLAEGEGAVRQAIRLAKGHRYEPALECVCRYRKPADYRFTELAKQADQAYQKIAAARRHWTSKRDATLEAARTALEREEFAQVVRLLKALPEPLLDEDAKEMLATSQSASERVEHWRQALKEAWGERDVLQAALALNQLLLLDPAQPEYQQLAVKISKALIESAEQQMQRGRYAAALERLDAIPESLRDEQIDEMTRRADDVRWMLRQFASEPFVFPRLGRLAQQLAKRVPDDPRSQKLVQELAKAIKQPAPDPRQHVARWKGNDLTWRGAPVRILTFPQSIENDHREVLHRHPGALSVAIGLALQALGVARIKDPLYRPKKKGLKTLFQRRGTSEAVGIDVGSYAVRAVHLKRADNGDVRMIHCWQERFEEPLCRAGLDIRLSEIRREGLARLAEHLTAIDAPIWANLPGRDVLGRFILLPPMKDKDVTFLLDREVEQQFPVGKEDLVIVRSLQSETESGGGSRRGALVACRERTASERVNLLQEVGIEVDALQCDPLALLNYAAFEFNPTDSSSLVIIDAGANALTYLAVTSSSFWFRALEGGGEDLTAKLARTAKLTAEQAEKAKRDPASLALPAAAFAPLEESCTALASRLQQTDQTAQEFLPEGEVQTVWTCGGASLMHGWIPRVLCRASER